MDVPETGAVFAFGRSHLTISGDGNDNNYFFIKNDKIRKLICGRSQSGVICESGRLFVWGENPCGQLGIGTCENIVTKPSCVKHIKKLGHTVKDFQFGSNFSVLLTDSSEIFYAGKNIFPFNARIESLDGKLQQDITQIPLELDEFSEFGEEYEIIRAGDEHFALLNNTRDKLFGWGFNSHHQLATIDSYKVLHSPDVFFESEDGEKIKLMECGRLSTCVVTEFNDLYIVGRFGHMTISTFTKIREPITNSTITQLYISDDDDIFLVTECGLVFKSNDFRNIIDLRFDELKLPKNEEKIVKIAPGTSFISIQTENGRCFSWLNDETSLIESGKLKNLRVADINAGSQHVLVSAMLRNEDVNGNQEPLLNQTYTINFKPIKGLGSGEENYQEPDTGENLRSSNNESDEMDKISVIELSDARTIGSRATTLECNDAESSGDSSTMKLSPDRSDSTIRFIDNGVDKTLHIQDTPEAGDGMKMRNGSVRILIPESEADDNHKGIERQKTPMPRGRKAKTTTNEGDLDENGIIDRDEDLFNDDDDVSTSTLHGSDFSLQEYIKEENKINDDKTNRFLASEKMQKLKKFMSNMKDKGKGLTCKNADNVITESDSNIFETIENGKDHSKSCSIM